MLLSDGLKMRFCYSIGASSATFSFCPVGVGSFYHFHKINRVSDLNMSRF